ncbi:cytochrome b561 and DOMON domain-containing protein At5g47530-like [Rhododendron vialii]|uniref:cytochrome b561 and DOMON domain-containing protein At5g47530-like n=1 Tax=Rhododendron vialii TaxID=182163 RepID=UPI00265F2A1B|nr:cytochrome b561 and DOMON domain-containing protein At5g47530-like [Rhododendron vialii]
MCITSRPITLISILVSLFLVSSAQTCSNYTFTSSRVFSSCIELQYLQAHLHWTYIQSTRQVEIAYRSNQTSEGWIAWAINPNNTGMLGSQALVAFHNANGSMTAYPTAITNYNPSMVPGTLSFKVSNISAEYSRNQMTIFAVVGPLDKGTMVNHVWQSGSSVSSNIPQMHPISGEHVQSMGRLNFLPG